MIIKANVITKTTKDNSGIKKKKTEKMRTSVYVKWLLLPKWPVLTEILELEDL